MTFQCCEISTRSPESLFTRLTGLNLAGSGMHASHQSHEVFVGWMHRACSWLSDPLPHLTNIKDELEDAGEGRRKREEKNSSHACFSRSRLALALGATNKKKRIKARAWTERAGYLPASSQQLMNVSTISFRRRLYSILIPRHSQKLPGPASSIGETRIAARNETSIW
jgi:hypothetical protein